MFKDSFTVVIPTRNRSAKVCELIEYLRDTLKWQSDIVICDQSNDESSALRDLLNEKHFTGVRLFYSGKRGASACRNEGAKHTDTKWILFVDDDVKPDPNFLDRIANTTDDNPWIDAITTKCIRSDSAENFDIDTKYYYYNEDKIDGKWRYEHTPKVDCFIRLLDPPQCNYDAMTIGIRTGAFAIRKDAFIGVGGFDENMFDHEDRELGFRLWWYGYRVYFVARAISFHFAANQGGTRSIPTNSEANTNITPVVSMLYLCLKWFPGRTYKSYLLLQIKGLVWTKRVWRILLGANQLIELYRSNKRAKELVRSGPVYLSKPKPRSFV